MIISRGEFELDDDPVRVDRDALWAFLSTDVYWARWRARADVERQLDGAWRVVGVYRRTGGELVGFARAVSDGVALAYLADVYLLPEVRGRGLGKELIAVMIERGQGADFRWLLHTSDAHGLYAGFGFAEPGGELLERPAKM